MKALGLCVGLIVMHAAVLAETITLSGSVKDKTTLAPIDSARVEIVNGSNPSERYSVITNSTGAWSYTFDMTGVQGDPGFRCGGEPYDRLVEQRSGRRVVLLGGV